MPPHVALLRKLVSHHSDIVIARIPCYIIAMDDPSLRKVVVQVTDVDLPWRSVFRLTAKFTIAAALIYAAIFLIGSLIAALFAAPFLWRERPQDRTPPPPAIEIGAAPRPAPAEWLAPSA